MKHVLVTGASGFIGQHACHVLSARKDVSLIVATRELARSQELADRFGARAVEIDVTKPVEDELDRIGPITHLLHLAWGHLPDYHNLAHMQSELLAHFSFLRTMLKRGVSHLGVAGTCYEFGLLEGGHAPDALTSPVTAYGLAKDSLRKMLQLLNNELTFELYWLRLFFLYGPGQRPNALLPQLEAAIARGDTEFKMSGGEQVRDYLRVESAARQMVDTLLSGSPGKIVNICSGRPIKLKEFVQEQIKERGAHLTLKLGYYPYLAYEPMSVWGILPPSRSL